MQLNFKVMTRITTAFILIFCTEPVFAQKTFPGYQNYIQKGLSGADANQRKSRQSNTQAALHLDHFKTAVSWIGRRLHTISIDALVANMKKDGIQARIFNPVFTAEGAFIYEADLRKNVSNEGLQAHWSEISRNAGMQVLPFKISINPINQAVKIDVPLFAFRNMRKRSTQVLGGFTNWDDDYSNWDDDYSQTGFFRIVDRLDFVSLHYDNGISNSNFQTIEASFFDIQFKIDLKKFQKDEQHITTQFGGEFGFGEYHYKDNKGNALAITEDVSEDPLIGTKNNYQSSYGPKLIPFFMRGRFGFEYENTWKKVSLKAGINCQGGFLRGASFQPGQFDEVRNDYDQQVQKYQNDLVDYNEAYPIWKAQKDQWLQNNGYGPNITDTAYEQLSGNEPAPVLPAEVIKPAFQDYDKVFRSYFNVQPGIEVRGRVSNLRAAQPVFLGAGIYGNIPVVDQMTGKKYLEKTDFSRSTNDLMKLKFFVNF